VATGVVTDPPAPKKRRAHSYVGIVLLVISLGLFALAGFHIWRMVDRGYSYACTNGDGCTYDSPDISGDLSVVAATLPFAIITLVLSIMAFTFHRIRTAWGSSAQAFGGLGGLGGMSGLGSLPLLARTIGAAIAAARGKGFVWPGMPSATMPGMPGVTWPGAPGASHGAQWPGQPGSMPGAEPVGWPGTASPGSPPGAVPDPMSGATASMASTAPDRAAAIQATGLDAEAVVSAMHDVGMVSGTKRMYELDLAVTLPGSATYRVKHMTWVPVESIGRLYAGGRLRAKVDPADHNSLVLDLTTPPN
jgi:hypothetical protein